MVMETPILEPLTLPVASEDEVEHAFSEEKSTECLLCSQTFVLPKEQEALLSHLLLTHKLVIADVKLVADLPKYISHWRERFKTGLLTEFCFVMKTNSLPSDPGPSEYYYMLTDALPEDKDLRVKLQQERLEIVLQQQERERQDKSFSRECLFCRKHFQGNRSVLLDHMAFDHNFSVGQADNLVFCAEFLELLNSKLEKLLCLYCERTFKDRTILKEHMRKKQHKKINPDNKEYDKFYVVNYLELGKSWVEVQQERDEVEHKRKIDSDDEEWNDWKGQEAGAVCLFCDFTSQVTEALMEHMKTEHKFDFPAIRDRLHLSFYRQIKLINYIRRRIHQLTCIYCNEKFPNKESMLQHMKDAQHLEPPEASVWDQPLYYLPTYENDALLYQIEDSTDEVNDESQVVVPEDRLACSSILEEASVREDILCQHRSNTAVR